MRWTMEQVAGALGVALPSALDPVARLAGVSIDSRTVAPGQLFIAIRGPRHDGHDFVGEVLGRGIPAAIVESARRPSYPEAIQARLFGVEDTLYGMQQLAAAVLRTWREAKPERRVAAVAGSVGKTTTKEILAALLGARFRVLKSTGNLNNDYGLPLTLFQLEDEHDAVVAELGMSRRGELARLTRIVAPDVGVVTRVAVEHLEFFASIDEVALAERELIENLPRRGARVSLEGHGFAGDAAASVLNADDERVAHFGEVAPGRVITFGSSAKAEFRAENIEDRGIDGTTFELIAPEGTAQLKLPLIGRHNVMNAVAALAAASVWGIGAEDAARVFPKLQPADKRGEVVRFKQGFVVINDTYNSSPTALDALADLLANSSSHKRRILAAGEMLELGATSPELHRESGRHAAEAQREGAPAIDWIIGVQGEAAALVEAAIEAGHPRAQTKFFANSDDAGKFLASFITRGDLLLLKGSRGVKMEKILEALRSRNADSTAPEQQRGPKSKVPQPAGGSRKGRR
jgi:UDP-N-acetylmuramoyl-tripeptide--D-alanyl-D-alanine ligase